MAEPITQSDLHAKFPNLKGNPDITCMEDFGYLLRKEIHSCPICGKELLYLGNRNLETLDEHVLGDGEEGSIVPKFCFVCGNKYCLADILGFGWNSQGDFYTLERYVPTDKIKFIGDIHSSIGSWQREHDEKKAWEKSRTHRLELGCLMLEFELFPRNPFRWNVNIWWRNRWIMNMPGTVVWRIKRSLRKKVAQ